MNLETKALSFFEMKSSDINEDGTFEGYASVFDVEDSYKDVVRKGAFVRTLQERGADSIPMLWQHFGSQVIGDYTEMSEDDYGLRVKGRINLETKAGGEAFSTLKFNKKLLGLSIGFMIRKAITDQKTGVRDLLDVDLWEVSAVTFPANDKARISSVKEENIIIVNERRTNQMEEVQIREAIQSAYEALKVETEKKMDALQKNTVDKITEDLASLSKAHEELAKKTGRLSVGSVGADDTEAKEHKAAFDSFARKGRTEALEALHQKAMVASTPSDGGFLVPVELNRDVLTRMLELSDFRAVASVRTVGSSKYERLVNWKGTAYAWHGEETSRAETASPSFKSFAPPMGSIEAEPRATQEMLDDAFFNVEQFLAGEIAQAFAVGEGAAFISGDGVNKPRGLLTYSPVSTADSSRAYGSLQYVATGQASDWAASNPADILTTVAYTLKSNFRARARYMMNRDILKEVMLFKDSTGNRLWQPSLQAGQPSTVNGYPVVESPDMPSKASNAYIIAFGDFSAYEIIDRIGITMLRDPYTARPYVKFATRKRVGGGLADSEAVKLIKVASS